MKPLRKDSHAYRHLRCAACGGGLAFEPADVRLDGFLLWEGLWRCADCGAEFPHRQGVAFPAVLSGDWTTTLGEALARRRIFARELEGAAFEGERASRHEEQSTGVARVMDDLFRAAQSAAALPPGCSVLDVGAGLCDTTSAWAALGHDCVAVETEANNLLHLRFEGVDQGEPEFVDIPARRVHAQELGLRPHLFDRVVAPIHRLPFATGSFDVVFCRSVLHHLDDLPKCAAELMRVLRPGGLLIACSEPARGLFDREDEQLVGGIDKEDGLNEQLPSWLAYRRAFGPYVSRTRVQPWLQGASPALARWERFDLLGLRRRVWPGQVVEGWRLWKLLPFSASVNLLLTRNSRPVAQPGPISPLLPDFSIHDLADICCRPSLRESIDRFHEHTSRLARGWRRMRLHQSPLPPACFVPGLAGERSLQIGWQAVAHDPAGAPFRATNRVALVTLSAPADPRPARVELHLAAPGQDAARGRIRLNGIDSGAIEISCAPPDWMVVSVEIPAAAVAEAEIERGRLAVDLELVSDNLQAVCGADGSRREAGFLVRMVRLL